MIIDHSLLFDSQSAITASVASANILDLVNARDLGIGDNPSLKLLVICPVAFATTNSATLKVQVQSSNDAVNGPWETNAETDALPATSLGLNAKIAKMDLPNTGIKRYLRLNYVVGTGAFTAGKVTSAIVLGRDDMPIYPNNYDATN